MATNPNDPLSAKQSAQAPTGLRALGKSASGLSTSVIDSGNDALRARFGYNPANFDNSPRTKTGISEDAMARANANLRGGKPMSFSDATGGLPISTGKGTANFGTTGDANYALNQYRQANESRQKLIDSQRPENAGFSKFTYLGAPKGGLPAKPEAKPEAKTGDGEPTLRRLGSNREPPRVRPMGLEDDTMVGYAPEEPAVRPPETAGDAIFRRRYLRGREQGMDMSSILRKPRAEVGMRKGGEVPRESQWRTEPTKGGKTVHTRLPQRPRVVTTKPKVKQPGYAMGGKVTMPPEQAGPIGDVEQDMGEDTQQVAVRPGEYLLNPETVEFIGQGDYEQGVRQLNQIVKQATGEEPGPEMVEAPEGGEEMMEGFAYGGPTTGQYSLNDLGEPRARPPAARPPFMDVPTPGSTIYVDSVGDARVQPPLRSFPGTQTAAGDAYVAEQAARARDGFGRPIAPAPAPAPVVEAPLATPAAAVKATPAVEGPPLPRGMRWERAAGEFGKGVKADLTRTYGSVKNAAKTYGLRGLGGALLAAPEVAEIAYDTQRNDFYNDPTVPTKDKALQIGSNMVDTSLRMGGAILGGSIGAGAGMGWGSIPLGVAGGVGGYVAGDALWEGDNQALRDYRAANPIVAQEEKKKDSAAAPTLPPAQTWTSPQGEVYTGALPSPVGNYIANNGKAADSFGVNPVNAGNLRQIPGSNAQYAGNYGGQEVIVTRGANGEPVFTGLRNQQELAASAQRAAQAAIPKTAEQMLLERAAYVQNSWEPDAVRARADGTADKVLADVAAMEVAKAKAGGSALTPGELTADVVKVLEPMFAQFGDQAPTAMSQFMRDISATELGPIFTQLPPNEQAQMINDWTIQTQQINPRAQKAVKQAGSDFVAEPGLRGQPSFSNVRDAGFRDWLAPDSNVGLFESLSSKIPFMDTTQVADMRYFGQEDPFTVNYDDITKDEQATLERLKKQQEGK